MGITEQTVKGGCSAEDGRRTEGRRETLIQVVEPAWRQSYYAKTIIRSTVSVQERLLTPTNGPHSSSFNHLITTRPAEKEFPTTHC